jgi:transposase
MGDATVVETTHVDDLIQQVATLQQQLAEIREQLAEKETLLDKAQYHIHVLQQLLFGKRSERLTKEEAKGQGKLFNEAELEETKPVPNETPTEGEAQGAVRPKRKKAVGSGRRRPRAELERVEIIHDLDDDAKHCPWCTAARPVIGEERSEEYEVIPAKLVVKVHVRKKYGPCNCDDFIGNDEPAVITAPGPVKLLRGSQYSNNTAAFILVNKFVDGIPLYRQEAAFKRMGLDLGRGTMARQVLRISAELDVLWQSMKADLRASPVLGMDETTTQVIHEDGRSASSPSWMWVARGFTTGRGNQGPPHPIIWFEYADSRSGDVAQSILGNFSGYLQTDGYQGYNKIGRRPEITHVGCWAHIRREFYHVMQAQGTQSIAMEILHLIGQLYKIENTLRTQLDEGKLTPEAFLEARKEATKPVFEAILTWLQTQEIKYLPSGPLGSAIQYALGQYRRAIRYVDHWLLTPDNNPVENAIRPFVIGRKNWLFHDTPKGATASARLYSLIETAKANGHEPFRYLRYLFSTYPTYSDKIEAAQHLLPYRLTPSSY